MNSPCLLVKSIALAEKGNKCNKNRCSRPAPNFGSGPPSQSSMHDGLRWNGETARSLRLRNRNPISVALNAYDNPSPPPHLSVLNYLQMSFENQFIGVFFSQFRQKAVKLNVRPFLQMCYIFWDGLSFNLSKLWKKSLWIGFWWRTFANNSTNSECVEDFKQSRLWRCLLFTFNVFYFFIQLFSVAAFNCQTSIANDFKTNSIQVSLWGCFKFSRINIMYV